MKKGFTLIEMLIITAIIGSLAAIAIPKFKELYLVAKTESKYKKEIAEKPYLKKELEQEKAKEIKRIKGPDNDVVPEELFRKDGCIVYRFWDNGRNHYFANCAGSTLSEYSYRVGKTQHYVDEEISTSITDPKAVDK